MSQTNISATECQVENCNGPHSTRGAYEICLQRSNRPNAGLESDAMKLQSTFRSDDRVAFSAANRYDDPHASSDHHTASLSGASRGHLCSRRPTAAPHHRYPPRSVDFRSEIPVRPSRASRPEKSANG